jgi:hypothetical protein
MAKEIGENNPLIYKDPDGTICFERADLVRIVAKFLDDMGYTQTTFQLEAESGIKCQSSDVSQCLDSIVQGRWRDALLLLSQLKLNTEFSSVELLVLERKFAELIEDEDLLSAIQCLRIDVARLLPADMKQARLEKLSRCLIAGSSSSNLQPALRKVGLHSTSRLELAKAVKANIAPSELIPSGMLESFVVNSLKQAGQQSQGGSSPARSKIFCSVFITHF